MNPELFAGYASCPDTLHAYESYSKESQLKWIHLSENVIREFIDKLSHIYHFEEAYRFLALKRQQIALELGHKLAEGNTESFGYFRKEGDHARQTIHLGDGEQFWKWQKNKVFELVYQLIKPVTFKEAIDEKTGYVFENDFYGCLTEKVIIDEKPAFYYGISVKSPYKTSQEDKINKLNILSTIELFDFLDDKKSNRIRIEYAPANTAMTKIYYQILDEYFQALIAWKPEKGINAFLMLAGELTFLLAHLLLVKHGNVGITEWMLRGIAYKNGLLLGHFNHGENISWDFKAILTPNRDEYVKWFCEKAFIKPYLINPTKPFAFVS